MLKSAEETIDHSISKVFKISNNSSLPEISNSRKNGSNLKFGKLKSNSQPKNLYSSNAFSDVGNYNQRQKLAENNSFYLRMTMDNLSRKNESERLNIKNNYNNSTSNMFNSSKTRKFKMMTQSQLNDIEVVRNLNPLDDIDKEYKRNSGKINYKSQSNFNKISEKMNINLNSQIKVNIEQNEDLMNQRLGLQSNIKRKSILAAKNPLFLLESAKNVKKMNEMLKEVEKETSENNKKKEQYKNLQNLRWESDTLRKIEELKEKYKELKEGKRALLEEFNDNIREIENLGMEIEFLNSTYIESDKKRKLDEKFRKIESREKEKQMMTLGKQAKNNGINFLSSLGVNLNQFKGEGNSGDNNGDSQNAPKLKPNIFKNLFSKKKEVESTENVNKSGNVLSDSSNEKMEEYVKSYKKYKSDKIFLYIRYLTRKKLQLKILIVKL